MLLQRRCKNKKSPILNRPSFQPHDDLQISTRRRLLVLFQMCYHGLARAKPIVCFTVMSRTRTFAVVKPGRLLCLQEIDVKAGGGHIMTLGEMVKQWTGKLEWYGTLFPRIPVPIQKDIERKMKAHLASTWQKTPAAPVSEDVTTEARPNIPEGEDDQETAVVPHNR